MADIAEVADIYAVYFHQIDRILTFSLAFYGVMVGGNAQDQYASDFIFPRAFDNVSADNPGRVGMPGMGVADGNDIRGLFTEGIAEISREWVGYYNSLAAPDTEAGMS
jgi:hypothetical protein